MAPTPTLEGMVPFEIPQKSDIPCVTYYKVFGDLSSATPLLVLHGGPGAGHEYLLPLAELWPQYGIPVVFYDQIGCASSTHLPQLAGDETFWQEPLFIAELNNILDHLDIRNGFHLLGHSWGGMLAAAFAASRPAGLKRLVLASALATMKLSEESIEQCRSELPPEILNVLQEYEKKEDYDNPAYQQASMVFNQKFMCRTDPLPSEMFPAFKNLAEDQTVYKSMVGPVVSVQTGSLRGWTSIPRLHQITAPTLLYNGEYDTSRDISQVPFFELIPSVRWFTFPGGSHMNHVEGGGLREKTLKLIGDFLTQDKSIDNLES